MFGRLESEFIDPGRDAPTALRRAVPRSFRWYGVGQKIPGNPGGRVGRTIGKAVAAGFRATRCVDAHRRCCHLALAFRSAAQGHVVGLRPPSRRRPRGDQPDRAARGVLQVTRSCRGVRTRRVQSPPRRQSGRAPPVTVKRTSFGQVTILRPAGVGPPQIQHNPARRPGRPAAQEEDQRGRRTAASDDCTFRTPTARPCRLPIPGSRYLYGPAVAESREQPQRARRNKGW